MSALIKLIQTQPAKITAAVTAIFNALILLDWVSITDKQLAGINVALTAVFGLFVASQVTPNVKLPDSVVVAAAEGHPPIPEVPPQP